MKKKKNKTPFIASVPNWQRFSGLKRIALVFLLTLGGANLFAQDVCPDSGWENEPVQQEGSCCALFDMLPSSEDFPWAYWFVVADEITYSSDDYETGEFKACFGDGGMHNVVVTYVDAMGVTLCENDWTVFIDDAECLDPCEDCLDFIGIEASTEDDCTFDFEMNYTVDLSCEGLEVTSLTWDFGDGTTGEGETITHPFPETDAYSVTATIEFMVGDEICTKTKSITAWASGCGVIGDGVDCHPFKIITTDNNSMTIGLPAKDPCDNPSYVVTIREFGTEDPFEPATVTFTEVSPDIFEATITELEPCKSYEILAELFCDDLPAGACRNEDVPWETDCPPPCTGCITFNSIDIKDEDRCDYTLSANYEITGACGDITITSIDWDLGFDGPDGTETGETVDVSFLCTGEYTVTATISYSSLAYPDVECSTKISRVIDVVGCDNECASCYLEECLKEPTLTVNPFGSPGGCTFDFLFDWATAGGSCGEISVNSTTWDFGYPGGSDIGEYVSHSFPENGTYTVTVEFKYTEGGGPEKTCHLSTEVEVTDCDKGEKGRGQIGNGSGALASDGITATTIPNPADDQVTITVLDPNNTSKAEQLELVIIDINGREVYRGTTRFGSQKMIDVSHFQTGLYIYEVRNGETVLLKEKLLIK